MGMAVRVEGKCPKRMRLGCERGAEVLGEGHACMHACMRVVAENLRVHGGREMRV